MLKNRDAVHTRIAEEVAAATLPSRASQTMFATRDLPLRGGVEFSAPAGGQDLK